ncbi:pyridoxamine 5'-phosphate oxidase [Planosporangium thailandense]|uniref:Pyridoxamine 5'-phosphate oxidase n=1 Tax=Planosporangium thailandense TaxID=765197 RepID=A0ABX0XRX8_9ACTN|nr:pyridoxamine 5'-phosphate oxidase family protein [Planosporangium thailandense]NJC68761.1 pyridoxamine 5'-phosphate oxidase [Planosporangium thailandense]
MATWPEFAVAEPQLAASIHALVHQYGPGLGYLATVRPDGGPRVHPVAPFITRDGLFCFVINSPKRSDLERDGRYALHSFPPETSDDEAYVAGLARLVSDAERVQRYAAEMRAEPRADWRLYEFTVDVAMIVRHTQTPGMTGHPGRPFRRIWRDPRLPEGCEVH